MEFQLQTRSWHLAVLGKKTDVEDPSQGPCARKIFISLRHWEIDTFI